MYSNDKNIYIYFDKAVICYTYRVCRDDDDDTTAKRK